MLLLDVVPSLTSQTSQDLSGVSDDNSTDGDDACGHGNFVYLILPIFFFLYWYMNT